jgi:hypothetical protein
MVVIQNRTPLEISSQALMSYPYIILFSHSNYTTKMWLPEYLYLQTI